MLSTSVRTAQSVVTVTTADAKTGQVADRLSCTPEHPLYVQGQGWVLAGNLSVGTSILTRAGPALFVVAVGHQKQASGYTVYNLTVEDDHTFFVGTTGGGTWVHNTCAFDVKRAEHIFRDAAGHVNPSTLASKGRFARLFEKVGSDAANLRADAVAAGVFPPAAAAAGANAFTKVFRNGKQVWVFVRGNKILDAGINAVGSLR